MAFNVTVKQVEITEAGKGPRKYKQADVTYTYKGGDNRTQRIMSFANPDVFKTLSELKTPADVSVETTNTEKDGKTYTNWSRVSVVNGAEAPRAAPASSGKVVGSNYETAEERKFRQLLIVRQSSISNAIEFFKAFANDDQEIDREDVISLAQVFVDFVYNGNEEVETLDRMPSDIPE